MKFAIAAGNDSENTNNQSPARLNHSNIWTVSAFDNTGDFASFSNYGNPPVDYAGPGVSVPSLHIGGGWGYGFSNGSDDGTSYAAPHIAGLLLVNPNNIAADSTVDNDPDSNADPIAIYDFPLEVSITGPGTLNSGSQGTWTAVPDNAEGTVSYQWYYKVDRNDSWHAAGSNSDTFSYTFFNTSSSVNTAGVKVDISSSGKQATYSKDVAVSPGGDDCDDVIICK